jgi:hypothetical protein
MKIAILGAGTYGSYVVDALQRKYPEFEITVFEVGDTKVKNEQEIGFLSSLKRAIYKGLTDGRWFGFGGASAKWGGQLLTFTENDFHNPDNFMQDIIKYDKKYKESVLTKFNIVNDYQERYVTDSLFTKTGVWLSVFGRNFFNVFKINKRKNVKVLTHCRIVKLESSDKKKIDKLEYIENGITKTDSFDYYFLTAGAFESVRILLSSDLMDDSKVYFSDHLSQKVFKIKKSTKIGNEDFVFRMKGTSLITKRLIGEIDNISFYAHPVFNMDFPFFESVKTLLFRREFSWNAIKNIFTDIPNVIGFAWTVLVNRRMFVLHNEWFLYIDIENPTKESYVELAEEKDKWDVEGLNVYYSAGKEAERIYNKAKNLIADYLKSKQVDFDVLAEKIDVQTCEDIYHPYGMFDFKSIDDYFVHFENMLVVNTGILPRSGGINPTAALLPVIDEFINNHLIF